MECPICEKEVEVLVTQRKFVDGEIEWINETVFCSNCREMIKIEYKALGKVKPLDEQEINQDI